MDFYSRPQRSRTWAGGTREAGPPDQRERSVGDSAALCSEPTMIGNFCGSYNRDTNNKIVLSLLINVIGISLHPLPPFGNLRWRSPTHRIMFSVASIVHHIHWPISRRDPIGNFLGRNVVRNSPARWRGSEKTLKKSGKFESVKKCGVARFMKMHKCA